MLIINIHNFLKFRNNFCVTFDYEHYTAWKASRYGVISGPYFPVFGLNTEIYKVNSVRIQSKYRKTRTRNNSVFGHFSSSVHWSVNVQNTRYFLHQNVLFQLIEVLILQHGLFQNNRSSHWMCSVEKSLHKNLANFTWKHLCWSVLFIKLQAWRLAGFFLHNLLNF